MFADVIVEFHSLEMASSRSELLELIKSRCLNKTHVLSLVEQSRSKNDAQCHTHTHRANTAKADCFVFDFDVPLLRSSLILSDLCKEEHR